MSAMSVARKRSASVWGCLAVPLILVLMCALVVVYLRGLLPQPSDAPRVARQGEMLVRALDRYRHDSGKCPNTLDELVPRYLDNIPHPGMRADRPFVLRRPYSERDQRWTGDSPYAITMDMAPSGTLVYRPSHKYEDLSGKRPGGRPVGDWYLSDID